MSSIIKGALFLVLAASTCCLTAQDGVICGIVLNEAGDPATSTHVVAMFLSGPQAGAYDSATTDSAGHYCMEHLRPGEYSMSADDPERGYPMLGSLFYALHAPEPRVTVSSGPSQQIANWRIPYKAGTLRVDAADKTTGKPISGTLIYLAVRGSEELRYMRSGWGNNLPVLLPPNEDVYVSVSAGGYRSWPTDGSKGKLLILGQGEAFTLTVALELVPKAIP